LLTVAFKDALAAKRKQLKVAILEVQRMGDDYQELAWQTHDNEDEVLEVLQVRKSAFTYMVIFVWEF
jgi:hypothetical protein